MIELYDSKGEKVKAYGTLEILLDDEKRAELEDYCKRYNYRFELKGSYIILKKIYKNSRKKENEKVEFFKGEWVDDDGNLIERVDKVVNGGNIVCFYSEKDKSHKYVLLKNFIFVLSNWDKKLKEIDEEII